MNLEESFASVNSRVSQVSAGAEDLMSLLDDEMNNDQEILEQSA